MSIYTRNGDDGTTADPAGGRISKADPQIHALGSLDELNAALGWCRACDPPPDIQRQLSQLQSDLFALGAEICKAAKAQQRIGPSAVSRLEVWIDDADRQLPPLEDFILPGGSELTCRLHLARTACRRAERAIAELQQSGVKLDKSVLAFVNRLSDLLFMLARLANLRAGLADEKFKTV